MQGLILSGGKAHACGRSRSTTQPADSPGTFNSTPVRIPSLVYHGWKCISEEPSVVVNVPTNRTAMTGRTSTV